MYDFGNVFEVTLAAGETIDIEPGVWIINGRSVQMPTMLQKLSPGFLPVPGRLSELVRESGQKRTAIRALLHGRR